MLFTRQVLLLESAARNPEHAQALGRHGSYLRRLLLRLLRRKMA